ncbi:MAG: hypothetical protein CMJ06_05145 [Pelagibacterales bacterium]|nr:hypothetical protein [Pelagibacterales bacterium]OUU61550.1 MAG: hypothetical protein CBC22_07210 [Alphaproteobacteria bacterium TMED62]|tara:strand:- start:4611 stop:4919 length:309 start_codon:yes stop_codon:yes gene_type:complete
MNNFINKIKHLKKNRDKQIKKLNKILDLLVSQEWDMVSTAYDKNDRTCFLAAKSLAEAAKNIQASISQLISADFSEIAKKHKSNENDLNIQPLKKVVLGKNK